MMPRMNKCNDQLSAKLLLQEQGRQAVMQLSVFGSLLQRMAKVITLGKVTQDALLTAPPFLSITYNDSDGHNLVKGESLV